MSLRDLVVCWLVSSVGVGRQVCLYFIDSIVTIRCDNVWARLSDWIWKASVLVVVTLLQLALKGVIV